MASLTSFVGNVPLNYETYLGPLFFEPYAVDLAGRAEGGNLQALLEIACGTGRLTKHLLKLLAPDGRLLATDLNEGMLNLARQSVADSRVSWAAADAQNLPYPDRSFDLVACQFGVMFFPDKPKAFREAFRVLKPRGRFLFNTWDHLRHNALADTAREVLQEMFPGGTSFLDKGPHSFYDTQEVKRLLEEAGFTGINVDTVRITSRPDSIDDCVNGITDGTPLSVYLEEHRVSRADVKWRIRERLRRYNTGNGFELPMQAHVCKAQRP